MSANPHSVIPAPPHTAALNPPTSAVLLPLTQPPLPLASSAAPQTELLTSHAVFKLKLTMKTTAPTSAYTHSAALAPPHSDALTRPSYAALALCFPTLPPSAALPSNRAPYQPCSLSTQADHGKGLRLRQHGRWGYAVCECEQSSVLCCKAGSPHSDDARGEVGGGGRLGQR